MRVERSGGDHERFGKGKFESVWEEGRIGVQIKNKMY